MNLLETLKIYRKILLLARTDEKNIFLRNAFLIEAYVTSDIIDAILEDEIQEAIAETKLDDKLKNVATPNYYGWA